MKIIDRKMTGGTISNRRKVILFTVIGFGFGLCVGYTFAKLAHWLMSLH